MKKMLTAYEENGTLDSKHHLCEKYNKVFKKVPL